MQLYIPSCSYIQTGNTIQLKLKKNFILITKKCLHLVHVKIRITILRVVSLPVFLNVNLKATTKPSKATYSESQQAAHPQGSGNTMTGSGHV